MAKKIKICHRCQAQNEASAVECSCCGYDLFGIKTIAYHEAETSQGRLILQSLDKTYEYDLTSDSAIIGRDHDMRMYLSARSYVSRNHARLSRQDDSLYVEDLNSTNFTYVNGERITGTAMELKEGDLIGIGGDNTCQDKAAFFRVIRKEE